MQFASRHLTALALPLLPFTFYLLPFTFSTLLPLARDLFSAVESNLSAQLTAERCHGIASQQQQQREHILPAQSLQFTVSTLHDTNLRLRLIRQENG